MAAAVTERCDTCKFARPLKPAAPLALLDCRVEPPKIDTRLIPPDKVGIWPKVDLDGWCGRWEKK